MSTIIISFSQSINRLKSDKHNIPYLGLANYHILTSPWWGAYWNTHLSVRMRVMALHDQSIQGANIYTYIHISIYNTVVLFVSVQLVCKP